MNKNKIPAELTLAINNLAENIRFSDAINNFQITQKEFHQDQIANQIMEELSEAQKMIRQKQMDNQVTADDLQALRTLQNKALENKVINSYTYSRQEAVGHLREINAEISNLLGIDFAFLAKKTTC